MSMQADESIRSILSPTPEDVPPFVPDLDRVGRRARSRRHRRTAAAGLVLAVLVAGVAVPLALLAGLRPPQAPDRAGPGARPIIEEQIRVPAGAVGVAVGEGAVWVTGFNEVSRLDAATNEVVATVPTPGTGDYGSAAVGEGAVWVTTSLGSLYRIDPSTNEVVATIEVGESPTSVTVGGGSVWVSRAAAGPGDIVRVDPRTNEVAGAPIRVGEGPGPALFLDGTLWVTTTGLIVGEASVELEPGGPSLVRVDPATGTVTPVDGPAVWVSAYGAGDLWGVSFEQLSDPTSADGQAVVRIDPQQARVTETLVIDRAQEVAFGQGYAWVLTTAPSTDPKLYVPDPDRPGTVVLIDPATNEPVGEPLPVPGLQPLGIAFGEGSAWIPDYNGGTVTRVGLAE
jgi:YVTN family beta-propeller protein